MRRTIVVSALVVSACSSLLGPGGTDSTTLVIDSNASNGLFVGDTVRLTAREPDASGALVFVAATYSTSDTNVATVNSTGLLTAKAAGYTALSVKTLTLKTSRDVYVDANISHSMNVAPLSADLPPGSQVQFYATVGTTLGHIARGKHIVWTSSDTSKATTDSLGLVTYKAVGTGRVSICAAVTDGSGVTGCASILVTLVAP